MQADGMLRGTRAVYLLVLLVPLIGPGHSRPLQLLPSIPGYIPVYIRHGDQPLDEINPALAEAFHESPIMLKSIKLEDHAALDPMTEDEETNSFVAKTKERADYPVHVREVKSDESVKAKDSVDAELERTKDVIEEVLKDPLESHEKGANDTEKRQEGGQDTTEAVIKVRDMIVDSDGLPNEAEKEGTRPNGLEDSKRNFPDSPREAPRSQQESLEDRVLISNVGTVLIDEEMTRDLVPPEMEESSQNSKIRDDSSRVKDVKKGGHRRSHHKEPPVKTEPIEKNLSHIQKIPQRASVTDEILKSGVEDIKSTVVDAKDVERDLKPAENNDAEDAGNDKKGFLKEEGPAEILSNVDKIPPLPTNEQIEPRQDNDRISNSMEQNNDSMSK